MDAHRLDCFEQAFMCDKGTRSGVVCKRLWDDSGNGNGSGSGNGNGNGNDDEDDDDAKAKAKANTNTLSGIGRQFSKRFKTPTPTKNLQKKWS